MTKSRQSADFAAGGPSVAGKNAVINSGFDIWQRGTSIAVAASTPNAYTADRWAIVAGSGVASTVSRQVTGDTTNLPNIQYCGRFQRNSGQTGTAVMYVSNAFETVNSIPFVGQQVTLSFYARRGANFSSASNVLTSKLYFGTGTDQQSNTGYTGATAVVNQNNTLTTTWQRFTATGTVGTTANELSIEFSFTPSGTAGAADYFEITGVQLEIGQSATPFSRAGGTIQGELAACCRYFESYKSAQNDAGLLVGTMYLNNSFLGTFGYSEKRIEPSFTIINPGNFDIVYGATVKDSSGLTLSFSNPNKKWTQFAVSSTGTPFTQGNAGVLRTDLNFEIQINAEL